MDEAGRVASGIGDVAADGLVPRPEELPVVVNDTVSPAIGAPSLPVSVARTRPPWSSSCPMTSWATSVLSARSTTWAYAAEALPE